MSRAASELFPDEHPALFREVVRIWGDDARARLWWTTPNALLGGKAPEALVDTPEEQSVRDLLRTIKYIGVS
jgi:uncharacterized protein (DUF2384 family)